MSWWLLCLRQELLNLLFVSRLKSLELLLKFCVVSVAAFVDVVVAVVVNLVLLQPLVMSE